MSAVRKGLSIDLPTPPSTNAAYNPIRGRLVLAKVGRVYKRDVATRLTMARWKPIEGDVTLSVHWRRRIRSGDLSNRLKILEDALKGFAWHDDSQVVGITMRRSDDKENPGVTISVEAA